MQLFISHLAERWIHHQNQSPCNRDGSRADVEPIQKRYLKGGSDRTLSQQVILRIASGGPLTDIAEALHVSVKTVGTYRSRNLLKLQMQTDADLVRYALEHSLIA